MAVDPRFWQGRRVLVTGHSGFKGAWLALWLHSIGAEVTGLSPGPAAGPSLYELAGVRQLVDEVAGDVRDGAAVRAAFARARPEVVLHLAAQPIVRRAHREPAETFSTNVMGTVNVLDAARTTDSVRAVVNVTTDKVYEDTGGERPYREDDRLGGAEPYSSSKACSELVTAAYRRAYCSGADGVRLATARAGNVIGGGDFAEDRLVPDVMRAAIAGEQVLVRNPGAIRPWQHVLEPLSGYLRLAELLCESPEHASAWNFGPGEDGSRPVGWVVDRLAELWPGGIGWTTPDGHEGPHEAAVLRLDSSRARARLGWEPRWDLDDALAAVVEWYAAYAARADMRATTLEQIASFASAQRQASTA